MPAMNGRNGLALALVGLTLVALTATPALAEKGFGDTNGEVSGDADGQDLTALTEGRGVSYDDDNNGKGPSTGALTPVGDWSPPPCWYTPMYSPQQLKDKMEPIWAVGSTGHEWDRQQREKYAEGGEKEGTYEDFNMANADKGYWWDGFVPEGGAGVPGALDCQDGPFWVDTGDPPPAEYPEAVTPEILAELAYGRIRVPDTDISLAPKVTAKQTVNLPTWAWLDKGTFQPVSVTASVPVLDIWATTTATPVSLKIEPGTDDADLHPASGECPIKDGQIGTPYTRGHSGETPPCGLTYLRATPPGSKYPFRATITWEIEWEGSGGTGGDLPNGSFGTTTDLTVQEIQTVVR